MTYSVQKPPTYLILDPFHSIFYFLVTQLGILRRFPRELGVRCSSPAPTNIELCWTLRPNLAGSRLQYHRLRMYDSVFSRFWDNQRLWKLLERGIKYIWPRIPVTCWRLFQLPNSVLRHYCRFSPNRSQRLNLRYGMYMFGPCGNKYGKPNELCNLRWISSPGQWQHYNAGWETVCNGLR